MKTVSPSAPEKAEPSAGPARASERRAVSGGDRARWAELIGGMARLKRATGAAPAGDSSGSGYFQSVAAMRHSRGEPLAAPDAARFGPALGVRTDDVRVHTDGAAHRAAGAVGARAVTAGRDVYFGQGQYRPGTAEGDRLLKHELTHTAQQRAAPAAAGSPSLSHPADPDERAATRAESTPVPAVAAEAAAPRAAEPPAPERPPARLQRILPVVGGWVAPLVIPAAEAYGGYQAYQAYKARNNVVELKGHDKFEPDEDLARWIWIQDLAGSSTWVSWQFGSLASGQMEVWLEDDRYQTTRDTSQLDLEELGDEDPDSVPVLQVKVADDQVQGAFGGVQAGTDLTDHDAVADKLAESGGSRLVRWRGLQSLKQLAEGAGAFTGGHLEFHRSFSFDLAGAFHGEGKLDITDGTVTFNASADIQVPGLETTKLQITRDASGKLTASGRISFTYAGFSGNVLATFSGGVLDIRGTVAYSRDGFEGKVTVLVTDAEAAWRAVNGQIAAWGAAAVSAPAPTRAGGGGGGGGAGAGATPSPPAGGGAAAGAAGPGATPPAAAAAPGGAGGGGVAAPPAVAAPGGGPRHAIAGWGTMRFRYKDWLDGKAQVIVDPDGHITSLGRIHVPRSIVFMKEKRWEPISLIGPYKRRAVLYNLWDLAQLNVTGNLHLTAEASLGPGQLTDVFAEGWFSTRPGFENVLKIGGTLSMRAMAALQLDLSVSLVGRATFPLTGGKIGIDIVDLTLSFKPRLSAQALASATASISRSSTTGGAGADYIINGMLAFDATAALTLSGSGTLDFPIADPIVLFEFDGTHWTLGRLRARLPFRHHILGSEPGQLKPSLTGFTGLMDLLRGIGRKKGFKGGGDRPDDAETRWEDKGTQEPIAEQPEATPASIPTDPAFGMPTVPPVSQAPAEPPPGAGAVPSAPAEEPTEPPTGAVPPADAGAEEIRDAGVGPIAGVPEAPAVLPPAPPAPPEAPTPGELTVPFEMEGTKHKLILEPGHPPVLLMSSTPGRLSLKLKRKKDAVDREIKADVMKRHPLLTQQRDVLADLIAEAEVVEERAADLGFGDRPTPQVPGMAELAARLQSVADQFDWRDLDAYIPTGPSVEPPIGTGEAPGPPAAPEVLNLPFDKFMDAVAAMQPAEALATLRDQRKFYEREISDINQYLAPRPSGTVAEEVRKRKQVLLDRIVKIDREIRRLEARLNPSSRAKLPCFSPETPVLVPGGGARPIASMREGDPVLCMDPRSRTPVPGTVVAVHRNLTLRHVRVTAGGVTVSATGRHPFWVEDVQDWVAAEKLEPGMRLWLRDGRPCPVEAVEQEQVAAAPTVNLSIEPFPTYFVGPGLWVHNVETLDFVDPVTGKPLPTGPFKIYLGTNAVDPEFKDCIYVGQTNRTRAKREKEHQDEALDYLDNPANKSVPDDDPEKRYFRFKRNMTLQFIIDGIIDTDGGSSFYAKYLEQQNIDIERGMRPLKNVMNRRDEVSDMKAMAARIIADGRAGNYCP